MKAKLFSVVLIVLFTASAAFTIVTDELHQAMTKMMQKMKSLKMTGNADYDFAMMMAEHHQGSIDMSDVITSAGKDEKKNLAQSILDKQPKEQQQLRGKSNSSEPQHAARNEASPGSNFSSEMNRIMSKMESDMNNVKMTNNYDHDFATMMIPHHQSAIDMVDAFLPHGQDQEIITLAEKIKSDSEKEKEELKKWLQNHSK